MKLEKGGEISVSIPQTEPDCVRVGLRGRRDFVDRVLTRREALVVAVELINLVDPCFLSRGEPAEVALHDTVMPDRVVPDTSGLTDQGREFVNEFYREQDPAENPGPVVELCYTGLPIAFGEYEDDQKDTSPLVSTCVPSVAAMDDETA